MAFYSPGPELSARYVLTGSLGSRAVFNDQTDPDFVGMLTDQSGFDSPEVRDESEVMPLDDGGITGVQFFGRRPVTLTGLVLNPPTMTDRSTRVGKLQSALRECMRSEGSLAWTLSNGTTVFLAVKNQQPLRVTGKWQKEFMVALVASDPRIYGANLRSANFSGSVGADFGFSFPMKFPLSFGGGYTAGQLLVTNDGGAPVYPVITITGPATNPNIVNYTTGERVKIDATIGDGEVWVVDFANRKVTTGTTNMYYTVDPLATTWFGIQPGVNDIRFQFASSSVTTTAQVQWRDAWL